MAQGWVSPEVQVHRASGLGVPMPLPPAFLPRVTPLNESDSAVFEAWVQTNDDRTLSEFCATETQWHAV